MDVRIERSTAINKGNMIAFVDVTVNDLITIRGCRIISANNGGKFVSMPSRKDEKTEKYYDHCFFTSRELKDEFSHLVTSAYAGNGGSSPKPQNEKASTNESAWEE